MKKSSIARAVENPQRVFESPQDVVQDPKLSTDMKLQILKSWEQDAHQLQTSTDENMRGGEPSRLAEVRAAIDRLEKTAREVS